MGLKDSFGDLSGTLISILRTRLELFAVEAGEQKSRLIKALAFALGGLVLLTLALLVFSLFLALLFWSTEYRYAVIGLLALVYALVGLRLLWAVRQMFVSEPLPFSATLEELQRDVEALKGLRHPTQLPRHEDTE